MDQEFHLNKEPLWAIPVQVSERLREYPQQGDYDNFKLSALYCGVSVFFLCLIGFAQLYEGNVEHAIVLLCFAAAAVLSQAVLWLGSWYWLGKHFTTSLMALLCLYLFHSGGVLNTGPLYYAVFPPVALFLQGRLRGFVWVIALVLLTLILWGGAFGFDASRYSNTFVTRILFVTMIIAILTCVPEYFRIKAERDLMLSINDLEAMTYGDMATRLANRTFLEKILLAEFSRNLRYGSHCCLMFLEADPVSNSVLGAGADAHNDALMLLVADVLRRSLRVQDVAGRWERRRFLLILPEVTLEGAKQLGDRLLDEIRQKGLPLQRFSVHGTASAGVAAMDRGQANEVLKRAMNGLLDAQKQGGGCCIAL